MLIGLMGSSILGGMVDRFDVQRSPVKIPIPKLVWMEGWRPRRLQVQSHQRAIENVYVSYIIIGPTKYILWMWCVCRHSFMFFCAVMVPCSFLHVVGMMQLMRTCKANDGGQLSAHGQSN